MALNTVTVERKGTVSAADLGKGQLAAYSSLKQFDRENEIKTIVDFGYSTCFDGHSPIINADTFNDLAYTANDVFNGVTYGDWVATVGSGQNLPYAGGKIDFSPVTAADTYITGTPDVAAAIWADPQQKYIGGIMVTLPSAADAPTNNSFIIPMLSFNINSNGAAAAADIFNIGFIRNGSGDLTIGFLHQEGAGDNQLYALAPNSADLGSGKPVLIGVWRDGSEIRHYIRSVNGTVLSGSIARADNNTQNFSACRPRIGAVPVWGAGGGGQVGKSNFAVYNAFVGALNGGRSPKDVLDAHWEFHNG